MKGSMLASGSERGGRHGQIVQVGQRQAERYWSPICNTVSRS